MWNWYQWDSKADFDAWHNNLMELLGYPLQTQPPTTAYTTTKLVQGKWIAIVQDAESEGLTLTEIRPPLPDVARANE
jgi:hypothetical protein